MKETRRMSSIARKINSSIWLRRVWDTLWLNVVVVAVAFGMFVWQAEKRIPDTETVSKRNFYVEEETSKQDVVYVIVTEGGGVRRASLRSFAEPLKVPAIIVFVFELLQLLGAVGQTGIIRKKMKPLNDLAIQAEQMSRLSHEPERLRSLETEILQASPEEENIQIHTGDKELESIEIALNNLLHTMKESENRQTRFVSDASHELRTPISVIQGYVNMLDRWGKEDESVLEESIEALKNESQHMKELVEQLLFLARGDSGRNALQKVPLNLTTLVQEVWEESVMIDETHQYVFDGKEPTEMVGDIAMVKQSMRVFIQNAAKYSPAGNTIALSARQEKEQVCYVIQDEGIGMEEAEVVHIFDRFYRSDEARNSESGGAGLGLSIAKWIVDAHNGKIEVLSRPEIGTRFTVWFPRQKTDM